MPKMKPLEPQGNLDQLLSSRLTLVITSADNEQGIGLDSLLAGWGQEIIRRGVSIQIARLVLQENHNDPQRFLEGLQLIIGGVIRDKPSHSLEDSLVLMLNSILDGTEHLIVVLENYHVIDTPEIHAALAFLLDYLPPRLHVVIASLEEPPLPIPRLRARRQMVELRV